MALKSTHSERREAYYSGRVQGVGFRYTANRLAANYPVGGFVRNLPDGRVHLVAEGASGVVAEFLANVATELGDHISEAKIDVRPATGEFEAFQIRY